MSIDPALMGGVAPGGAAPSNQSTEGQVPTVVPAAAVAIAPGGGPAMPPGAAGQFQPADPAALQQLLGGPPGAAVPGAPQQKPSGLVPATLAKHIAGLYNERKKKMAQFMADSFGLPRGIVDADEETLVRAWLKRDKGFDVTQARLDEMAEDEIADRAYPLRRPLITIGHPTFSERVEFAEKMAALAADPKYSHLHEEDEDAPKPKAIIPTELKPQEDDELLEDNEDEEVEE